MARSFVLALALTAAVAAPAAHAESLAVKTADLDLATASGQKKLDQRIVAAARKICGAEVTNTGTRVASRASGECVRKAVAETQARFASRMAQPTS